GPSRSCSTWPTTRCRGLTWRDAAILARRRAVYERSRLKHAERWARGPRNWTQIRTLTSAPNRRSRHCDYRVRGRLPAGIQVTAEDVANCDRRLIGRDNGIGEVSL